MAESRIAVMRKNLANRANQIRELKGQSVPQAAGHALTTVGGAFVAGAMDRAVPVDLGVKPSFAAGIATVAAGAVAKSPNAIRAGAALMAPQAYEWGQDAADALLGSDDEAEEAA